METPSTSVSSPSSINTSKSEEHHSLKKDSSVSKKRRKSTRKSTTSRKSIAIWEMPGVKILALNHDSQRAVGCVIGEDVTSEKPWIPVEKELIMDHIEYHNESSEFLPIKNEIDQLPLNEIMIGFIPDETRDHDEFYVCFTEKSNNEVIQHLAEKQRLQEERIKNTIYKVVGDWVDLGSHRDIKRCSARKSRPLIEVEIESKYPLLPFKIKFKKRRAQDARDGYLELHSNEDPSMIIQRKRINNFVQVTLTRTSKENQTFYSYPRTNATQYELDLRTASNFKESAFLEFIKDEIPNFLNTINVNAYLNFYSNDYTVLSDNSLYKESFSLYKPKENISFIDVYLCKGKMVSDSTWHPMWSGVVAISYVDLVLSAYTDSKKSEDDVTKVIHGLNPVLLWSFDDDLKPKLVFETYREVHCLSFCPYNENLLVGGCSNGQIILWDIKDRLKKVEIDEILTKDQERYKAYMYSLMDWMKNIYNIRLVSPTVISNLSFSHKGTVTSIRWLSPYYKLTKTGKFVEITDKDPLQLIFMTSSEDGTILFWDLYMTIKEGGAGRPKGKLNLKGLPKTSKVDVSPFKYLNLILKPIYKINMTLPTIPKPLAISILYTVYFQPKYNPLNSEDDIRKYFEFNSIQPPELSFPKDFFVGTMLGDFVQGNWEGSEFDSGLQINCEDCHIKNYGKYHDGPIVNISISPCSKSILTIGGRIFAIWRQDFHNKPIIWRKSSAIYAHGGWYSTQPSKIRLIRIDGYIEIWYFYYNSKTAMYEVLLSNGTINIISVHQTHFANQIFGFSDHNGCFRCFSMPKEEPSRIDIDNKNMEQFINRYIERKKKFLSWQEEKRIKYEEENREPEKEKSEIRIPEKKPKEIDKSIAPVEPEKKEYEVEQEIQIRQIILDKKQMDTEELIRLSEPIKKIEEENEIRRRKQKKKIAESSKIFNETVAMFFPEVVREKPPPPLDMYTTTDLNENDKFECYQNFQDILQETKTFVEDNSFSYDFNWINVLNTGKDRRKKMDDSFELITHIKRYEMEKCGDMDENQYIEELPEEIEEEEEEFDEFGLPINI